MDEIIRLATFVYNSREEERAKEKRQQKKEEVSVLAAVLRDGFRGPRGRGRERARRDRWNQSERAVQSGVNDCYYCGEQGHWQQECPVRPRVVRNRGTGMRQSNTKEETRRFPVNPQ